MKKNIIVITDNKAGHENISMGIVETINKNHDVNLIKINAKLRSSMFKRLITFLLNKSSFWKNKKIFIDFFYKNMNLPKGLQSDLIISTGGATSFLNIMLSQYLKSPNIYCSSLRGLNDMFFTHIVSLENHGYPNEIVVDLAPLSFTYNIAQVKEFKSENNIRDDELIWSVLIGGPTKDYPFHMNDFLKMIDKVIALAKKHNAKLLITTSRRTDKDVELKLQKIFEDESDVIKKYVLYNQKPEKIMKMFLAVANQVFCTEDSGSMITESILSKKPVYTLRIPRANPVGIYKTFINRLIQKRHIVSVNIDKLPLIRLDEPMNILDKFPSEIVYDHIQHLLGGLKK